MSDPTQPGRSRDLHQWHRDQPDRKLAGVCAGVAEQLAASTTAVRAGFLLLALFPGFHGIGLWLYGLLWFLMPAEPGGPSGLDRVLAAGASLFGERRDVRDVGPSRSDPR